MENVSSTMPYSHIRDRTDTLVLQSVGISNKLAFKKSIFNNEFNNSPFYLLFKCIFIPELLQTSMRLKVLRLMAKIHVFSTTKHPLSR